MPRQYKPRGAELEAFERRSYLMRPEYENKKKGKDGESFQRRFPTSRHYLYHQSLYWFHHDLILQNESWRKQLDPVHHWEMCKFYEQAVAACELKHSCEGDFEQLKKIQVASDYVLEAARDTFKSYIAIGCAVWVMGKYPTWTNLFARATDKGASKRLNQIAKHLLSNKALWEFFPHLKVDQREIKRKKLEFSKDMIQLSYGFDSDDDGTDEITYAIKREYTSEANMNAWGLNSSYTGAHVDGLCFIDDAVTEDNYKSETVQDTLYGHLAELSNIARETSVKVYIGTPYDENDALQRTKKVFVSVQRQEDELGTGMKVFEHFSQPALMLPGHTVKECLDFVLHGKKESQEAKLAETSIVFKSCHTPRFLRQKYHAAPNKRFFWSQYLLEIIPDGQRTFREEWLTFYGENTPAGLAPKRSEMRLVGLIDPAGGPNRGTDEAAILLCGVDKNDLTWILEAMHGKYTAKGLMDVVASIDRAYRGVDEWYMENFGMGEEFRGLLQQVMNAQGSTISIMPLQGKTSAGAKWDRIESSTWVWEMRRVRIHERHDEFLKQYRGWRRPPPPGLADHLLDLFGYFKNMIYAPVEHTDKYHAHATEDPFSISDLASRQIRAMREDQMKKHGREEVQCVVCGESMTLAEVPFFIGADNQPKCRKCGGPLWFGNLEQPAFEMNSWN